MSGMVYTKRQKSMDLAQMLYPILTASVLTHK